MVDVRLPTRPSQHLNLRRHHPQQVGNAFRRLIDIQALHQFGVLRGDAHRAPSCVAVVAIAGFRAELVIVVHMQRLVAVQGNQCGGADIDGVRAQRDGLGRIRAVTNAARNDELNFPILAAILQRRPRFANRRQSRAGPCVPERSRAMLRCRLPCRPPQ